MPLSSQSLSHVSFLVRAPAPVPKRTGGSRDSDQRAWEGTVKAPLAAGLEVEPMEDVMASARDAED